jgi:hypothetical protein
VPIKSLLKMSIEDKQHAILRRYLLGELPEAERSELADRYFVDEEFFDELLDVENELVDQYVRGQLSSEERKNFGDYLRSLPDGESKLATAYALMEAGNEARVASPAQSAEATRAGLTEDTHLPTAEASPASRSRWESLSEWLFGGRHSLQYATATILIALVACLAYLIVTQRQLHRDLEQFRAERTHAEQEKLNLARQAQTAQQEQTAQRERISQLEQELARAQQQQEQQKEAQDTPQPSTTAVLASLTLTPTLRSGGTPDVLTLTRNTKTVSLVMPVASEEQIAGYRAVLQTSEGQLVFSQKRLRPQPSRRGRAVTLRLPAARLTGDSYKLTLQGKAADGIEIAQDYYFNIVRK